MLPASLGTNLGKTFVGSAFKCVGFDGKYYNVKFIWGIPFDEIADLTLSLIMARSRVITRIM